MDNVYKEDTVNVVNFICEDAHTVFGWANVSLLADGSAPFDWENDFIPIEQLENAAYNFTLTFRESGEQHLDTGIKGRLIESMVFTDEKKSLLGIADSNVPLGWWVGFYIEDEDVWQKVKEGKYSMFSIQGTAKRIEY